MSRELSDPSAAHAGFSIAAAVDPATTVQIYAITPEGTAMQFVPDPALYGSIVAASSATSIIASDGRPIPVVGLVQSGNIDKATRAPIQLQKLTVPPAVDAASYSWLVLRGSFRTSTYVLADSTNPEPDQTITFKTLPSGFRTIYVRVGSCLQWHGYDTTGGLFLERSGPGAMPRTSIALAKSRSGP